MHSVIPNWCFLWLLEYHFLFPIAPHNPFVFLFLGPTLFFSWITAAPGHPYSFSHARVSWYHFWVWSAARKSGWIQIIHRKLFLLVCAVISDTQMISAQAETALWGHCKAVCACSGLCESHWQTGSAASLPFLLIFWLLCRISFAGWAWRS